MQKTAVLTKTTELPELDLVHMACCDYVDVTPGYTLCGVLDDGPFTEDDDAALSCAPCIAVDSTFPRDNEGCYIGECRRLGKVDKI